MGSLELGLTAEHNYSSYLNCHLPAVCSGQCSAVFSLVEFQVVQCCAVMCNVVQLCAMLCSAVHRSKSNAKKFSALQFSV